MGFLNMPAVKSNPIQLANVRISYPNLWRKDSYDKYGAALIIDEKTTIRQKDDKGKWVTMDVEALEKVGVDLARTFFNKSKITRKSFEAKMFYLKDGDEESARSDEPKPEYEGYQICHTMNWDRPKVLDRAKNLITESEQDEIEAGYRVNASIHVQPWQNTEKKTKGVRAVLRAVQMNAIDEVFGAAPCDPDEEFDTVDDIDDAGDGWDEDDDNF